MNHLASKIVKWSRDSEAAAGSRVEETSLASVVKDFENMTHTEIFEFVSRLNKAPLGQENYGIVFLYLKIWKAIQGKYDQNSVPQIDGRRCF